MSAHHQSLTFSARRRHALRIEKLEDRQAPSSLMLGMPAVLGAGLFATETIGEPLAGSFSGNFFGNFAEQLVTSRLTFGTAHDAVQTAAASLPGSQPTQVANLLRATTTLTPPTPTPTQTPLQNPLQNSLGQLDLLATQDLALVLGAGWQIDFGSLASDLLAAEFDARNQPDTLANTDLAEPTAAPAPAPAPTSAGSLATAGSAPGSSAAGGAGPTATAEGSPYDSGLPINAAATATGDVAAPQLELIDADGKELVITDHSNTIVVSAASWCSACAEFKQALAEPEVAQSLEGLRIVFAFGDETASANDASANEASGEGRNDGSVDRVQNPEFLDHLPGEVAFLSAASVRPDSYPTAYNPLSGQFDFSAKQAVRGWLALQPAERASEERASEERTAAERAADEPTIAASHAGSLAGDFNADHRVDATDLALWQSGFGVDGSADADGDLDTDGADFLAWQRNFGQVDTSFNILGPSGTLPDNENAPLLQWQASTDAFSYDVHLADDAAGTNFVESHFAQLGTSLQLAPLAAGTYFVFITANNLSAEGGTQDALNNGLSFTVEDVPTNLEHVVFVTNIGFSISASAEPSPIGFGTSFGGLQSADFHCTDAAIHAGLTSGAPSDRTYKALISDSSTDARDRMLIEGRLVNTNGDILAANEADFWDGTLDIGINYDQNGNLLANNTIFWTGSDSTGVKDKTCLNWSTQGGQMANVGLSQSTVSWFNQAQLSCGGAYRLVCISPAQPQ